VDGVEIVKTEIQMLRKLLRLKAKFDTDTKTGDVMHHAVVKGLFLPKDLPWMTDLCPLQPSAFHYRMILLNVKAIASHFEQPASLCRQHSARRLINVVFTTR
jgi:hypothetical protein